MPINLSTLTNQTNPIQLCKAWVNFNGTTATPSTIRSSYNVSSVTKNATGDYTVNFATALADANYTVSFGNVSHTLTDVSRMTAIAGTQAGGANTKTASALRIVSGSSSTGSLIDLAEISAQVFGN
jgi:hypothetical protein